MVQPLIPYWFISQGTICRILPGTKQGQIEKSSPRIRISLEIVQICRWIWLADQFPSI
jgi:hypothetical protein